MKPEAVQGLWRELQRGELSRAALGRGLREQDGWHAPPSNEALWPAYVQMQGTVRF